MYWMILHGVVSNPPYVTKSWHREYVMKLPMITLLKKSCPLEEGVLGRRYSCQGTQVDWILANFLQ